jgi:hypothetical protein
MSPWWSADRYADVRPFLVARRAVTQAVRAWFEEQGFAEVETGILQVSPGNETHLHAPRAELTSADGSRFTRYLRTSPEFAAKKLLAAGDQNIFDSRGYFATASAAICTLANSPCWNGTGPMPPTKPSWPIAWWWPRMRRRRRVSENFRFAAAAPIHLPSRNC